MTKTNLEYETFELMVGARTAEGYPLTIIESPAGEAHSICLLDPTDAELRETLSYIEDDDIDAEFLTELGSYLFEELFTADIAALYRASLGMVRAAEKGLRVRLRLDTEQAPEIAALPWEYLYDSQEDGFLALSADTALVRYVPMRLPVRPTTVSLPLRLLVIISNPRGVVPLDVAREKELIQEVLQENIAQKRMELQFLDRATMDEICQAMRDFNPHIFHFIGHGQYRNDEASVILENDDGSARVVDERTFREFFQSAPDTRLAVLNACQTGAISSAKPLAGLAPRVLQRKLSAVVAMQYTMPDQAALIFSREFYRCLARGDRLETAVTEARKGIFMELGGARRDWGTPVLFLRTKDGLLFELEEVQEAELLIPPPPEPTPVPDVSGFVGRRTELASCAARLKESNLVLITGMPGVGKSALAAALARQVGAAETIFWHSLHEDESIEELIWALIGFLYWQGQDELWNMIQRTCMAGGKLPPTNDLLSYLVQMFRGKDYLLCLTNLQFLSADDTTVLGDFTRRLAEEDVSSILASQTTPPFVSLSEITVLEGLSRADIAQLLTARGLSLSAGMQEQLYRCTDGNAQFLALALEALQATQHPETLITQLAETANIERYLINSVDKTLSAVEREVMGGVAMLLQYSGTRGAIEALLNTSGLRRVLIELGIRNLVTTTEGKWGKEYGQNALIQQFYYSLISRDERRTRHRRAGIYYETEEHEPLRAAHHFLEAEEYQRAASLLTDHAQELVNEGQARTLQRLLERLTAPQVSPEQWAKINLTRGDVLMLLGAGAAAEESYREALANIAELPGSREMKNKVSMATVWDRIGTLGKRKRADMATLLDKMDDSAQSDAPEVQELRIRVCLGLAQLHEMRGAYTAALSWITEGLDALDEQSTAEGAELHLIAGLIHTRQGDYEQALAQCQKGLRIAERLNVLPTLARAYNLLGHISRLRSQNNAAIDQSRRALELYAQTGNILKQATSHNLLANAYFSVSQWAEAQIHYQKARDIFAHVGDIYQQAVTDSNLGGLALNQGRLDAALTYYRQALQALKEIDGSRWIQGIVHMNLGATLIRQGDFAAARAQLDISQDYFRKDHVRDFVSELHRHLAEAALMAGELDNAEAEGQEALALAREMAMSGEEGCALRVLGEIAAEQEQFVQAGEYLMQSVAVLTEVGDEYECARSQLALTKIHARQGDQDAAQECLAASISVFECLEAELDLAAARALAGEARGELKP